MSSIAESQQDWDEPYQRTQAPGRPRPSQRRPGFLTAPFEGRVWRESLHLLLNFPIGLVGFAYAVILLSFGFGTVLTFIGLPVLAVALLGCQGLGAMERARARATLDLDLRRGQDAWGQDAWGQDEYGTRSASRRPSRPGLMGWIRSVLTSGAAWRSVLYSLLMLPFGVLSFSVTLTLWVAGIGYGSYPLWQWVFPHYVNVPGLQLYSDNGHTVYLSSVPQIAGVCAAGLVVLFLAPWAVRGLASVQRAMVRGLLR